MRKTLLEQFLDELDVKYTHRFASKLFNEHPNKYNMLGLKQMLHRYGIESVGVKQNEKKLEELVYPCILHIHGDFVIGRSVNDGMLEYLWTGKVSKESVEAFNRKWTGNALLPDADSSDLYEPDYKTNVQMERIDKGSNLFLILLPIILIVYGCINNEVWHSIPIMSLLAVNIAGGVFSLLLMQKQLFKENRFADRICSLLHQQDCNNVLFSDKARLLETFSWSEIGVAYFLVQSLALALYPQSLNAISIISWMAMPYGIWSIWYQWRIAKQWCILCVIVQILLWTSGIIALLNIIIDKYIDMPLDAPLIRDFSIIVMFIILTVILLHNIANYIHYREELATTTQKYNAIKCDATVFNAKFQESEEFPTTLEDSTIVMGAKDAKFKVTVLGNPHCQPCARMHKRICKVLKTCPDTVSVQYIYSAFNDDLLDSNRFLIAVFQQSDSWATKYIYDKWYKDGKNNAKEFIAQWNFNLHTPEVDAEMERHRRWRERTKLSATPTIIVNNRLLPRDTYQIEDLINM